MNKKCNDMIKKNKKANIMRRQACQQWITAVMASGMLSVLSVLSVLLAPNFAQAQTLDTLEFGPQNESKGERLDEIIAVVERDVITARELTHIPAEQRANALQQLIIEKLLLQQAASANIAVGDTAINIAMEELAQSQDKTLAQLQSSLSAVEYAALRDSVKKELMISRLQQQVVNSLVQISDREIADVMENQLRTVGDRVNLVDVLVQVPESADPAVLRAAQEKTAVIRRRLATEPPEQVAADYDDVFYNPLGWVELGVIPPNFAEVLVDQPIGEFSQPIVDRDGIHLLKVLARETANNTTNTRQRNNDGNNEVNNDQAGTASSNATTSDTGSDTSGAKSGAKSGNKGDVARQETLVSHILIRDNNNPEAKSQIDAIYERLQAGEAFAALAKTASQDVASAVKGGDLGWVAVGQMVPEFERAMQATDIGEITAPIKTPFGYHIIQVNDRRLLTENNRALLEQQARQTIFRRKAAQEWELWLSRLRDEAYVDIRIEQ